MTSFFRDPEAFETLEAEIIPAIFKGKSPGDPIRIWIPGCSTGEEAYSLAILIKEYMERLKCTHEVQIFATDVDKSAIETARAGQYPESIAADITTLRLKRYFKFKNDRYQVVQSIREMIIFAPHDLLRDPPFFKLDLISCRNLLIYITSELQKKIVPLFFYSLLPNGILFLGPSETIGQFGDLFHTQNKKWKMYRRSAVETRAPVDFSSYPPPFYPRRQAGRPLSRAEQNQPIHGARAPVA